MGRFTSPTGRYDRGKGAALVRLSRVNPEGRLIRGNKLASILAADVAVNASRRRPVIPFGQITSLWHRMMLAGSLGQGRFSYGKTAESQRWTNTLVCLT